MSALCVVVSGPPASGKSTLAPPLARALDLPHLAKDSIKEALLDEPSALTVDDSRRLGRAAVRAMIAVAARCPQRAVLETVVHRSTAQLLADVDGRVVEVFCRCDQETARSRFLARAASPAGGHFDTERVEEELWNDEISEPAAAGWPVVEVDTNRPVDLDGIVDRLGATDQ